MKRSLSVKCIVVLWAALCVGMVMGAVAGRAMVVFILWTGASAHDKQLIAEGLPQLLNDPAPIDGNKLAKVCLVANTNVVCWMLAPWVEQMRSRGAPAGSLTLAKLWENLGCRMDNTNHFEVILLPDGDLAAGLAQEGFVMLVETNGP